MKIKPYFVWLILFISLEIQTMRDQLTVISVNSHNLTTLTVDLQSGLNDTIDNLTRIQNNCSSFSLPFCNDINTDGLKTQADFTNLPNVSQELSNIEKVINQDFEKAVEDVSYSSKIMSFLITIHMKKAQYHNTVSPNVPLCNIFLIYPSFLQQ